MSYLREIKYKIMPEESFEIICNCSGCGCKTLYRNTNNFRVNANGNKIDIWLIYQCTKCKHTNNLTVYERTKPENIEKEKYEDFLKNSSNLAFYYGRSTQFFAKNKAEINWSSIKYNIKTEDDKYRDIISDIQKGDKLIVKNNYNLRIRKDKVISEILNVTRKELKEFENTGIIYVVEEKLRHRINVEIRESIR